MADLGSVQGVNTAPGTLIEFCRSQRAMVLAMSKDIKRLMKHSDFERDAKQTEDFGEAKANIMLAYRHIEDARMRLGKVIEAMDGGESIYDRPTPMNAVGPKQGL